MTSWLTTPSTPTKVSTTASTPPFTPQDAALLRTTAGRIGKTPNLLEYYASFQEDFNASATRNAALPDVATLAEQGFPDTSADNWYGLLAPARTPAPIVAKLNVAVTTALADPELRDKLVASGAIPAPSSSAEFAMLMREELDRWGQVVRAHNIKGED